MKNAVISASVMWHLANREKLLPRFAPDDMPAVPGGRGGGGGGGRGGGAGLAPTADPHIFAAVKGKALTVGVPGLLPYVNPDAATVAPPRTAAMDSPPSQGKVIVKPDGSFVYTPNNGYTGTDTFAYKVTVGTATSTPATVTIVIK